MGCCGGNLNRTINDLKQQIVKCCNQTPSSSIQFEPDRVLFVAQSWPVGVDPAVYFTSIQSAVNAAQTTTPAASETNFIDIMIAPGQYIGNVAITHIGINLKCFGPYGHHDSSTFTDVTIVGNVTYVPVATANSGNYKMSGLYGLTITGTLTASASNPGPAFPADALTVNGCHVNGAVTSSGTTMSFFPYASIFDSTTDLSGGLHGNANGSFFYGALTVDGAVFHLDTSYVGSGVAVINSGILLGSTVNTIEGGISVDGTSSAQLLQTNFTGASPFTGPGPIDRTWDSFTVSAATSPTIFSTTAPYFSDPTKISFTQTTGAAGVTPVLTAITTNGFSFTDAAARTWEVLVYHQ